MSATLEGCQSDLTFRISGFKIPGIVRFQDFLVTVCPAAEDLKCLSLPVWSCQTRRAPEKKIRSLHPLLPRSIRIPRLMDV